MESPCGVTRPDVVILSDDFAARSPKSFYCATPNATADLHRLRKNSVRRVAGVSPPPNKAGGRRGFQPSHKASKIDRALAPERRFPPISPKTCLFSAAPPARGPQRMICIRWNGRTSEGPLLLWDKAKFLTQLHRLRSSFCPELVKSAGTVCLDGVF